MMEYQLRSNKPPQIKTSTAISKAIPTATSTTKSHPYSPKNYLHFSTMNDLKSSPESTNYTTETKNQHRYSSSSISNDSAIKEIPTLSDIINNRNHTNFPDYIHNDASAQVGDNGNSNGGGAGGGAGAEDDDEINLEAFTQYLKSIHCQENLEFVLDLQDYLSIASLKTAGETVLMDQWHYIYIRYLTQDSDNEINLPCYLTLPLHYAQPPQLEILIKCNNYIINEILQNLYREFIKKKQLIKPESVRLFRSKSEVLSTRMKPKSPPTPRVHHSSCSSLSQFKSNKTQNEILNQQQQRRGIMTDIRTMNLSPPLSPIVKSQQHHDKTKNGKKYRGYDYYSIPQQTEEEEEEEGKEEEEEGGEEGKGEGGGEKEKEDIGEGHKFRGNHAYSFPSSSSYNNTINVHKEPQKKERHYESYESDDEFDDDDDDDDDDDNDDRLMSANTTRNNSTSTTMTSMSRGSSITSTIMDNSVNYFNNKMRKFKIRRFSD